MERDHSDVLKIVIETYPLSADHHRQPRQDDQDVGPAQGQDDVDAHLPQEVHPRDGGAPPGVRLRRRERRQYQEVPAAAGEVSVFCKFFLEERKSSPSPPRAPTTPQSTGCHRRRAFS